MGDYRKNSNFSGKGNKKHFDRGKSYSGRGSNFRNESRDKVETFKATCAECNKSCDVPFRPSGDRPVYCSDCFRSNKDSDSKSNERRGERSGGNFSKPYAQPPKKTETYKAPHIETKQLLELNKQLLSLNDKLDRLLTHIGADEVQTSQKSADITLKTAIENAVAPKKKVAKKTTKKAKKVAKKKSTKKLPKKKVGSKKK